MALLALTVAAAAIVAVAGIAIPPAGAHTAMTEASPAPDDTVGGTIDHIEIGFGDPVSDAVVSVSYNEEPLAGVTTVADGEVIRFELDEPLEPPGRYKISFEMISFDGDRTTTAYFFTYDVDAAQPAPLGQPGSGVESSGSGGISGTILGASAAGLAVLFGLLAVFVWRLEARREQDEVAL